MKIQYFITSILVLTFLSVNSLSAQTSLYSHHWTMDSQPWVASESLDLQRAIGGWKSCDTPASGKERVYGPNPGGYYGTTQAQANCQNVLLTAGSQGMNGYFHEYVGSTETRRGPFIVDKDKNFVVTLNDGKKLLIITDQLMAGVLVVREL